eukprot:927027_1
MGAFTKPKPEDLGKDWLFELTTPTIYVNRFFSTAGFVICVVALIWIIHRNNKSATIADERKMATKLWYVTLLTIVANGIQQLTAMFTAFPWLYPDDDTECFTLNTINYFMYSESKFIFWVYCTIRLHDVFSVSETLAYSTTFLGGLVVFFQIEVIMLNVFHILYGNGVIREVEHEGLCCGMVDGGVAGIMAVVEIFTNGLCLWLFYSRMRRLWAMLTSINSDSINEQTVELA